MYGLLFSCHYGILPYRHFPVSKWMSKDSFIFMSSQSCASLDITLFRAFCCVTWNICRFGSTGIIGSKVISACTKYSLISLGCWDAVAGREGMREEQLRDCEITLSENSQRFNLLVVRTSSSWQTALMVLTPVHGCSPFPSLVAEQFWFRVVSEVRESQSKMEDLEVGEKHSNSA